MKDYKEMILNETENRSKTASHNPRVHRDVSNEDFSKGGKGVFVNKVKYQIGDEDEEYETFRQNNDVKKHMEKFLRPQSQALSKRSTTLSPSTKYGFRCFGSVIDDNEQSSTTEEKMSQNSIRFSKHESMRNFIQFSQQGSKPVTSQGLRSKKLMEPEGLARPCT